MNRLQQFLAGVALCFGTAGAVAQETKPAAAAMPDTSTWVCRFCPFEAGSSGWLEPAVGRVSDDSYRFGDYSGFDERGLVFDLSGAWRERAPDSGEAWDLRVDRAGLDSRALDLRGGKQGRYQVSVGYEQLPHRVARDSRTPFAGTSAFELPAGWTPGGSTGGMAALDSSLHAVRLRQDRERSLIGIALTPNRELDLRFDHRRDVVRGTGAVGASFMTLASQLPRPIDYTIDRADMSVAFRHALGQVQATLASSSFSNYFEAFAWQNPYSGPVAGARTGQMAQAPDNRAHRFSLTFGSAPGLPLQASAQLALGQQLQNQRFLPATVNPNETAALPRSSLDGRVDTNLATVRAAYRFGPGLRIVGDFRHDERDNRTPVDAYTQVVMDTFTGAVRSNAPFGFTRDRSRLTLERHGALRLAAGLENDARERRLAGTTSTDEQTAWGRLGWRPFAGGELRLRVARAQRDGSELTTAPGAAAQNPALRSFVTAERQRDTARGELSLGGPLLTTAVHATWTRDEYPDTAIGRTSGRETGYGTDFALQPTPGFSIGGFASFRQRETGQAGSQGFGAPDWIADQEDVTHVIGAHFDWQAPYGVELGADYTYSGSEGAIVLDSASLARNFPMLVTRWHDTRVFARYRVRPELLLRLDLVRERYDAADWALDGVAPDTVPNLLALGQGTQDADVTAAIVSLRYEFLAPAATAD